MHDHDTRACPWCYSLLHKGDQCKKRSAIEAQDELLCQECEHVLDDCICVTGFKLTPVPVTEVPDTLSERPDDQIESAEGPENVARVSGASFDEMFGDGIPSELPAEASIVIPEGHGSAGDGGAPPIKPDPKREREEDMRPSELPEAEVPQWLRRAMEQDKFRDRFRFHQVSPDGLLYEILTYKSLRLLAAGASGDVMSPKLKEMVRSGRAMMMLARELQARRTGTSSDAQPEKITMLCGAVVTFDEAYDHEMCVKCTALAKPTSLGINEDGSMKDSAELRGLGKRSNVRDIVAAFLSLPDHRRRGLLVDMDEMDWPRARELVTQSDWIKALKGALARDGGHTLCARLGIAEPVTTPKQAIACDPASVPEGHVEMPCGAVLPAAEATVHYDCEKCVEVLRLDDVFEAEHAARERILEAVTEWDAEKGYIEEGAIPAVVDFIMERLGREVIACAFCGESYEGKKPVSREQLEAHVRPSKKEPVAELFESLSAPRKVLPGDPDHPNNPTRMTYWLPLIPSDIPTPRSWLFEDFSTLKVISAVEDGDATAAKWFQALIARVKRAGDSMGWPCFLRTDMTSAKHSWKDTCFLESGDEKEIGRHIANLVVEAECQGTPFSLALVVREMLPTEPAFHAFHGHMPITKERRYFVKDGEVTCHHPYWPEHSIRSPDVEAFEPLLRELNEESEDEISLLSGLSRKVSSAIPGAWSVDWLHTTRGWYLIDMALAETSWHWDGCERIQNEGDDHAE